jgi:hypothetical protein
MQDASPKKRPSMTQVLDGDLLTENGVLKPTKDVSDRSAPRVEHVVVKKRLSMTQVLDGDLLTKDGMLKPVSQIKDRSAPRVQPSMSEVLNGDLRRSQHVKHQDKTKHARSPHSATHAPSNSTCLCHA